MALVPLKKNGEVIPLLPFLSIFLFSHPFLCFPFPCKCSTVSGVQLDPFVGRSNLLYDSHAPSCIYLCFTPMFMPMLKLAYVYPLPSNERAPPHSPPFFLPFFFLSFPLIQAHSSYCRLLRQPHLKFIFATIFYKIQPSFLLFSVFLSFWPATFDQLNPLGTLIL